MSAIGIKNCNTEIKVYTNSDNLSLDQWLDNFETNDSVNPVGVVLHSRKPISFSGISGLKGLIGCCMHYPKGVALAKGDKAYLVTGKENMSDAEHQSERELWLSEEWQESDDIYVKILSTFKFID